MNYQQQPPSHRFSRLIKHFWSLEQSAVEALDTREPVLPDGCPEIVFNLSDRFRRYTTDTDFELQPRTIIAGQMTRSIVIGPSGNVRLFGVRFQPFGAYSFLRVPMSELADSTDGLDLVLGERESELRNSLLEAETFSEQIAVFERVASFRIADRSPVDHRFANTVERFADMRGAKVSSIAAEIGWSERKLERDFAKYVGISPKMFGRISRFSSMVRAMENHGPLRLVDDAHTYGYYDQSHMINEFREFSGESPTAFYERSHRLSELFTVGE